MKKWWTAWVELMDRKEPATALAIVRILMASVLLIDLVQLKIAGLVEPLYARPPDGFAWGDALLAGQTAWLLAVIALALLVTGTATRAACIVYVFASAEMSHLVPDSQSAFDMLSRVTFAILALSQSHAKWSVDAWIANRRGKPFPTEIPAWPRYLLMLQLIWVYFSGGTNKSSGVWGPFEGFTALGNALSDPHAARFGVAWVGTIYPLTRVATVLTMVFELGAPLYLLAYAKRWRARWIWIALGISFEIGIAIGLRLGSFPYGMLSLFPVLLYPEELRWPDEIKRLARQR